MGYAPGTSAQDYVENHLPIIREYKQYSDADERHITLSAMFESTEFRKLMVDKVCQAGLPFKTNFSHVG